MGQAWASSTLCWFVSWHTNQQGLWLSAVMQSWQLWLWLHMHGLSFTPNSGVSLCMALTWSDFSHCAYRLWVVSCKLSSLACETNKQLSIGLEEPRANTTQAEARMATCVWFIVALWPSLSLYWAEVHADVQSSWNIYLRVFKVYGCTLTHFHNAVPPTITSKYV